MLYDIPAATAEDTVALIRKKLNLRGGLRAVGDRKASVRRVLLHPGIMTPATMWQRYEETDLIVAGEVREWENTHYAADIYTVGEKRGLVTIGRVVSEDPGMRACAAWLKTVVKEVPAHWITVGDLYWRAVLMTGREVVDLIKKNVGVPWNDQSYRDTFKLGNPDSTVKGIATTVMVTFDMLKRANQAGLNMVISHEDTSGTIAMIPKI